MTAFGVLLSTATPVFLRLGSWPAWKPLLTHDGAGLPAGCGVHVAGQGVGHQPVPGGFVGTAEVEFVFVQPAAHVGPADEVEVQPVVTHAAAEGFAVVVARLIPG